MTTNRFAHLGPVEVSRRDDRWLALGAEIVAFGADSDAEWNRLVTEAELLRRWAAVGVPVPRVIEEDTVRRIQVRERCDGITGEAVEPLLFGIKAESSISSLRIRWMTRFTVSLRSSTRVPA